MSSIFVIIFRLVYTLEGDLVKRLPVFVMIIVTSVLAACATDGTTGGSIEVRDAWARAATALDMHGQATMGTPVSGSMQGMGTVTAAYLVIHNNNAIPDRLLRVESNVAETVELHQSEMSGEVMTMRPINSIEVPAKGEAELKPGGMHMMLIGLNRDLKPGDKITLLLVFENAGKINVEAEVRAP